jgi:hypothetical protein
VSDFKSMKCYVLFILGTAKSHLEIIAETASLIGVKKAAKAASCVREKS